MTAQRPAKTTNRQSSARITYFDWLRGAATIAVVVLHVFNKMLTDHSVGELGVPLVLTWTELQLVFTRWAVPLFLMITGALLLDPKRDVSWEKIGRYVARMAAVLLVFCPVYTCMSARAITLDAIIDGLGRAFTKGSWDHLWYIYALIGLYLLTPILQLYVRHASQALQRTTLLVLAVPTLVIPTINAAAGAGIATFAWVTSSLLYYLLGTYAHQYLQLDKRLAGIGLAALAVGMAAIVAFVVWQHTYPKWLIVPECPLVALWALLLFVAAKRCLQGRPAPAILAYASRHSLGIYLFHPLILIIFYRRLWWMPYEQLPPVIFELVVIGATLAGAVALVEVADRIPGLRRIL